MRRFFRRVALVVFPLNVVACDGSDGSDSPSIMLFDGSRPSLTNFYSESQLVQTESLGLALNFGDDPPNVEGTFRFGPVVLQSSSDPDDQFGVGNTDPSRDIIFSNQDNDLLTLDVFVGTDLIEITNAVISGSGNAFSVFALAVFPEANGLETRMAFSGVLTEFGVENFQYAPFLAGSGSDNVRLFVDQDNLSERLDEVPNDPR